jgi:cytidylate kinase
MVHHIRLQYVFRGPCAVFCLPQVMLRLKRVTVRAEKYGDSNVTKVIRQRQKQASGRFSEVFLQKVF